ncbi:MAG: hypothetical protein FWG63_05060 [Defluviitaleaceae bacterium]|nr:hypothetical protein [Defluviitaleaceae bacterium]
MGLTANRREQGRFSDSALRATYNRDRASGNIGGGRRALRQGVRNALGRNPSTRDRATAARMNATITRIYGQGN